MKCEHLGHIRETIGTPEGSVSVHHCNKRTACTVADHGLQMAGGPMPVCDTCQQRSVPSQARKVFSRIAANREWGDAESISGPGSSLEATTKIREELPKLLHRLDVWSLLDLPCGDHHWMSHVNLNYIDYTGADVVSEIVIRNRATYPPNRRFIETDLIAAIPPKADAVLCRDCLVHLPFAEIKRAVTNIVNSGATWLITTTFPGRENHNIEMGHWRPIDLTAAPFNLTQPTELINEGCTEGGGAYSDKSLGVWRIDDIRAAVKRWNGPALTIGMATYRDWPGVWATVESILLHHAECLDEIEIVIVDNDPNGKPNEVSEKNHSWKAKSLCEQIGARYEHYTESIGTAAAKGRIFDLATGQAVLVMDCHVMLPSGTLRKLIDFAEANPQSKDLWQGPLLYSDCKQLLGTHFSDNWGSLMHGQWATDHIGMATGEPFEIPMQGCGLFACNRSAWPGFHPLLRGFGPEEGHLHNRIRRNGGKCLCLPWLKWQHRFGNPDGSPLPGMSVADRLRGYLITCFDTGSPTVESIKTHFVFEKQPNGNYAMTESEFDRIAAATAAEFHTGRADTGADCRNRSGLIGVVECDIGCKANRKNAPVYHCAELGACVPWKVKSDDSGPHVCLGCDLRA